MTNVSMDNAPAETFTLKSDSRRDSHINDKAASALPTIGREPRSLANAQCDFTRAGWDR